MTTLLLLSILAIGYTACWILRLQHRIKVISNGRLEATEGRYRALRLYAQFRHLAIDGAVEIVRLRQRLHSREVRVYELWVENNQLKDDAAFEQLRMSHLAGQLCECRHHLSPAPNDSQN